MFEPLQIVPTQYHTAAQLTPMQRLAWALLGDCFTVKQFAQKYPRGRHWQRLVEADQAWLADEQAAVPFVTVCDLLGLNTDAVRRAYFSGAESGQDSPRTAPQAGSLVSR